MKLGRLPRAYNPAVPHMSALLAGKKRLPAPPVEVDYTAGMPTPLGAMLNNTLSDCTCAAYYHARQVWTFNAQHAEATEPDSDVELMYEQSCGYNPADPNTDQGGVEQDVLAYLLNTGAPIGPGGSGREKLIAYVEVDPRNLDDVKRTIADFGVAYIGMAVPDTLMSNTTPGAIWSDTSSQNIIGGHAVVLAGYNAAGNFIVISWGNLYQMTPGFFGAYADEVYALADQAWLDATGDTPAGMTLAGLDAAMAALREGP